MRGLFAWVALAVALLAQPAAAQQPAAPLTKENLETWLDGFLPYALRQGDLAGAVVGVVQNGRVLLQKGYGYEDVEARKPIDPERSLMRPGSVSKLFTWTAVMQQVELGRLDLDRDVNDYLDFAIPPRDGQPVTLRNLMTHTGGFEDGVKALITPRVDDNDLERNLKRVVPERIFAPGTTPAYSNYGTALAGYIVQRVSGEKFDDYIERHIFQPLGMAHSTFRYPVPEALAPLLAKTYARASEKPLPYNYISLAPAGNLAATGADMSRFMLAHLQLGRLDDAQILKPETAQMMHGTPHTVLPGVHRMLLGFYESDVNGRRVIAHAGDVLGSHTEMNLFVDDGIGLFICINSSGRPGAVGSVRKTFFEGFADRYLPGPNASGEVDKATAIQHAAMMAGHYENSRRTTSSFYSVLGLLGQTVVTANGDGTISVRGEPQPWREIAPMQWVDAEGKHRLAAEVAGTQVVRFTLDPVAPYMMFAPTPWWRSAAWLMPALQASLAIIVLTLVGWPVAAVARRRYGAPFPLAGSAAFAHRAVRIASIFVLLTLFGWAVGISILLAESGSPYRLDNLFYALAAATLVVFTAAVLLAVWQAVSLWRQRRHWAARLWAVLLAFACATLLWIAVAFKMTAFSVYY